MKSDAWIIEVPCRAGGLLYPYSADRVVYSTPHPATARKVVTTIPGASIYRQADDGLDVTVPVAAWDKLVKLVRPIRRRELSEPRRSVRANGSRGRRPQSISRRKRTTPV